MQENSPYTAPEADISIQNADETYQPQLFTAKGRIGRLRYLAYSFGVYMVFAVIVGVVMTAMIAMGMDIATDTGSIVTTVAIGLMYVALIVFMMILAKRRLNDLDKSGWLSLVLLIPLVGALFGLYIIFASGTDGSNEYGLAPCENSTGVKILGFAFPVIAVLGIVAAVVLQAASAA